MDLRELQPGQTRRHPWERARVRALRRILRDHVTVDRTTRVLEVGCGDGYTVAELFAGLRRPAAVAGVDPALTDAQIAALNAARPGHVYTRSLEQLPEGRSDLLLLLDVLEHVEQDEALLRRLVADQLVLGGQALITVPAHQALFSAHDRQLRHVRRYEPADLARLVAAAGLRPRRGGALFASLLPARALSVALQRLCPGWRPSALGAGSWRRGMLISAAVELLLRADNHLLLSLAAAGVRLPGLTIWMLCQRP